MDENSFIDFLDIIMAALIIKRTSFWGRSFSMDGLMRGFDSLC